MKNNTWYRLFAALLCAAMLLTAAAPARVLADETENSRTEPAETASNAEEAAPEAAETVTEEIHIASAEDFLAFAAACTLDT